jgi:hypothetical protein
LNQRGEEGNDFVTKPFSLAFKQKMVARLTGKDGAKNAPAVLTKIADAFKAMWDTYDALWRSAKVER